MEIFTKDEINNVYKKNTKKFNTRTGAIMFSLITKNN